MNISLKIMRGRTQIKDEKDISTTQCEQEKDPWFPGQDEYQGWPCGLKQKEGKREEEINCLREKFTIPLQKG